VSDPSPFSTFPWPRPPGETVSPIWTGTGFQLGSAHTSLLTYPTECSGWADELSVLHEETVGPDHFMGVASRRHTLDQLEEHLHAPTPIVLEVGALSGFLLEDLPRRLPRVLLIGADSDRRSLEQFVRRRNDVPLLHFDLRRCPLPDSCVDAVVLSNVLEHIDDDALALRQVHRILKPGGVVVIEVPAGPHLYDVYDRVFLHHRRYALGNLVQLMKDQRFEVTFKSHLGTLLYPGFWYVKRRNRRYLEAPPAQQLEVVSKAINSSSHSIMHVIMRLEHHLRKVIPLPFGIRCITTGVKQPGRATS
jgi:SAM-dependent methyltransferase